MTNTLTARSGQTPSFYRQIFKLVLPIILQNLLSSFVSSADVVMLNYVGQSSISAVSLASNYTNILFMVFYGLGTGATMLCAQYHGKGDLRAIQVIEGIALRFSLVLALLIAAAALTAAAFAAAGLGRRASDAVNALLLGLVNIHSRAADDHAEHQRQNQIDHHPFLLYVKPCFSPCGPLRPQGAFHSC